MQFLLRAGARVDARMLNGCTPLHLAAGRGLNSISSTLCEAGADSLLLNVEDETPQDLAEDVRDRRSALQGLPPITELALSTRQRTSASFTKLTVLGSGWECNSVDRRLA